MNGDMRHFFRGMMHPVSKTLPQSQPNHKRAVAPYLLQLREESFDSFVQTEVPFATLHLDSLIVK